MLFEPFYEPSLRLISMKLRLWRLHPYYTEKGTFVKSLSAFFLHFFCCYRLWITPVSCILFKARSRNWQTRTLEIRSIFATSLTV